MLKKILLLSFLVTVLPVCSADSSVKKVGKVVETIVDGVVDFFYDIADDSLNSIIDNKEAINLIISDVENFLGKLLPFASKKELQFFAMENPEWWAKMLQKRAKQASQTERVQNFMRKCDLENRVRRLYVKGKLVQKILN